MHKRERFVFHRMNGPSFPSANIDGATSRQYTHPALSEPTLAGSGEKEEEHLVRGRMLGWRGEGSGQEAAPAACGDTGAGEDP